MPDTIASESDSDINRWEDLFQDIQNYIKLSPQSSQVKQAAQRWQRFLDQYGEANSLEQEYNRLHQSIDTDLVKKQQFYNELQTIQNFVSSALKASQSE